MSRRDFVGIGSALLGFGSASAISLDQLLATDSAKASATERRPKTNRSLVVIYLPGGPTQFETFDPKPAAPAEIRGVYQPKSTAVSGVHFCELLPRLSETFPKFSVIRSLVGMQNRHESFQCYTGRPGGRPQDGEPSGGWPTIGSAISKVFETHRSNVPASIDASPKMGYRPYVNRGEHDANGKSSWPGFTGRKHTPFALEGDVRNDLVLNGIDQERLGQRKDLLQSFDSIQHSLEKQSLTTFQQEAFGTLTSSRLADALDLKKEPEKVRSLYGPDQKTDPSFGGAPQSPQRLLLARRLVEAGARCVTVAFGAWDWHANREGPIDQLSKKYLPVFDHALATFLNDLDERGLLETTTVVVWGEFGRTPRINAKGGRDHWPGVQSVLIAGGGIQGGQVVGATDSKGGKPISRPVHVQEVFATLYRNVGIDVNKVKLDDLSGRPRFLVDPAHQPIKELGG